MAKDPYKYFRIEARELVEQLGAGVFELSRAGVEPARIAELLRAAHTLKGAARIVKLGEIAERAHAIEDVLVGHREGALPPERVEEVARLVRELEVRVAALTATPHEGDRPPAAEPLEGVRVHLGELDALLRAAEEVRLTLAALGAELAADGRTGGVESLAERAEREQRQLIAMLEEVRLVRVSTIVPALERATHEAAQALGKTVEVSSSGGEVRVDAHVLAGIRDAMVQLVRNAVAHGLETDGERRARGKDVPGRVDIRVEQRGRRVVVSCSDDGRGIDVAAMRRAAISRGLAHREVSRMGVDELVRLGVTTQEQASELAGRGVGLDVVRASVARLRGHHAVKSAAGRGTTVELSVPTSLASVVALVALAGEHAVAVPIDSLEKVVQVATSELRITPDGARLVWDDSSLPFAPCAELIGATPEARSAWTVLVVRSDGALLSLGVDRVLGTEPLIVWPLPELTGPCPGVVGAALDVNGSPRLVLEPSALAPLVGTGATIAAIDERPPVRILIVDDSLTTRMLEQSILESAGYEVDLASSAEEGLRIAAHRTYALFLVDVEMPGMDGFTFVERTLSDPSLRSTPSVLVTSRASDADKRRGAEAGARAYVVKSELAQDHLLAIIRSLTERTA